MAEIRKDRVRMVAVNYRKPGMSIGDYDAHWLGEHSKIFSTMQVVKENLLRYEQGVEKCHRNSAQVERFRAAGLQVPDFDGLAIFEAESYDKIMAVFSSEEYQEKAVKDEEKFLDRSRIFCFPADLATVTEK